MATSKKILVAVDRSPASRRAVHYVAGIAAGNPACQIGLLHLQLPPRMLDWGGAEDTEIENQVSAERDQDYRRLEEKSLDKGQALLKRFQEILADKHVAVTARMVQFEEPLDPKHITEHILKTAAEGNYGSVVVGRHSFSGLKRWFGHHVSDELLRAGKRIAIWVVE